MAEVTMIAGRDREHSNAVSDHEPRKVRPLERRPQQQQARRMQWGKGKNCIEMKSSNSTHRRLSVNHKKLPIAVDLAVTTCKVGDKPYQVKPPDAAELGGINAVIEIFDVGITVVKVFQPLCQRFGIVHAIEIPAFHRSEILVMSRNRIKTPEAAVRENIFVGINAGDVIGSANGNDVQEKLSAWLQERSKFSE